MKHRHQDELFLRRCLVLADRGRRDTHPNPMVGCVVVKNGKVIAEGFHRRFGGPHAETIALQKVRGVARGATLYVNLEPCAHTGKTPPCTKAIIAAGIRRVVASSSDPNKLVAGRGFRELRRAGIAITTGVLSREAKMLNRTFFHYHTTGLPFVTLKVAQTLDGKIADTRGRSKWITGPRARAWAHELRAEHDAILVGAETIRRDDPELTVRHGVGKNPVRIVLDGRFNLTARQRIFRTSAAPTILLTSARSLREQRSKALALERNGVQVLGIVGGAVLSPRDILRTLAGLGISSLLVEGGSATSGQFLNAGLVNRIVCITAPSILGSGVAGFRLPARPLERSMRLSAFTVRPVGEDLVIDGTLNS